MICASFDVISAYIPSFCIQINAIMEEVDADKDGEISFEEFKSLML